MRLRQRELTGFTESTWSTARARTSASTSTSTPRTLHEAMPDVHLKLYTASEIHHMTKLSGLTHEEVLAS